MDGQRGRGVPVELVTHGEKRGRGELRVQQLTEKERLERSRRWLFICLAIAPVMVLFPPHFPWPIITVCVGIVGYYLRRGHSALVLGGEATCPACEARQTLEPGYAEYPIAHFCTACRERLLIRPVAA